MELITGTIIWTMILQYMMQFSSCSCECSSDDFRLKIPQTNGEFPHEPIWSRELCMVWPQCGCLHWRRHGFAQIPLLVQRPFPHPVGNQRFPSPAQRYVLRCSPPWAMTMMRWQRFSSSVPSFVLNPPLWRWLQQLIPKFATPIPDPLRHDPPLLPRLGQGSALWSSRIRK